MGLRKFSSCYILSIFWMISTTACIQSQKHDILTFYGPLCKNIEENVNLHLALLFDLIFKSMLKGCQNRNGCRNGCWSKHQKFSEPKYNYCVITSDIGKLSFTNLQNLRFPGKITFADRGVWPQALIFIWALIWRFVQLLYCICQNVVKIL